MHPWTDAISEPMMLLRSGVSCNFSHIRGGLFSVLSAQPVRLGPRVDASILSTCTLRSEEYVLTVQLRCTS